ncbi:C13 family peptidase [Pseudomonas mangrovi]|uniref:Peptidase C13 n=1 Tax=Pseudomonas mangrovi TaxID=2161748 RepID=A0A2T5P8M7_9PSED|nr:C13 family peptidase [Pseudomonas mangrovi]PTU74100.1 peptidase C13 [Pseudomonas mangrovi]
MRPLAPLLLTLLLGACTEGEPLTPPDARLPDGSRYRGEVVDGLLQGPGRLDYDSGAWFEGQFKDGQPDGHGEWRGLFGEHYVGEFRAGLFDGRGVLIYEDGTRYEGQFRQSRMHGEGTLTQAGSVYRGEFKKDRYHGYGSLEMPDGSSHRGHFIKGVAQGQGVRIDAAGNQFVGNFRDGVLEGKGSYRSAEGDHYAGGFRADRFHGEGRYESASGDVWRGQFREGAASGAGEYHGSDGETYQGELRRWRYHGAGRLTRPDQSVYVGRFNYGRFHGDGLLTLADGSRQQGLWHNDQLLRDPEGEHQADPLDLALLEQGQLLQQAIEAVPLSTDAIELYSLSLAGDGSQSVFMREAEYAEQLFAERLAARGHISLINHRDHLHDKPMATRENLRRALQALAERSGKEDLIFIYLTSHGSEDHQLSLTQPRLNLASLPAEELARMLEPLRDRHKVLVVSACFSGGFIPPLKDQRTLVMTAARADRTSFGCAEDNDFTYFGRALLAEALQQTDDLERAFEIARSRVEEQEEEEQLTASEPQIWAPRAVLAQWKSWRAQQPETTLEDSALSLNNSAK